MTDSDALKLHIPRLKGVSEADVKRFLIARTKSDECFSCGSNGWVLKGDGDFYRGLAVGLGSLQTDDQSSLFKTIELADPVVAMVCTRCGFVRMHDLFMINLWLQNEGAENAPSREDKEGDQ